MLFFVFMPSSINAQILNKNSSVSYFKYKKIGEEEVIDPQLKTRDSIEIYKIQPTIDKLNKTSNNLRQRNNSIRRSNSNSNQLKPNGINHSNGQTTVNI